MSDLPEGWIEVELGETLKSIVGGGTPSRNVSSYFEGSIPWFTVKDMKSLKPSDAQEHISVDAVADSATNVIPANSLICATRIALGKAMRPTVACAINQDLKALFPGDGVDADFLLYWIISNEKIIQEKGSGTTVSGIRLETLRALSLWLPPEKEQTRIVAKLEELLSGLDVGVAELKAAQKKLAQYRQSLLKAAVQGDLTTDWRRQHPPQETGTDLLARILKQRRERWQARQLAKFAEQRKPPPKGWQEKYPEPAAPNTRDLPALPEGWVWASIEQIADVGTGVTPSRANAAYFQNGTTPWVTSGALNGEFVTAGSEFVSDAALQECRLEIYPTGSLLLAMYGEGKTRGKCSELMIPAAINQAIAAIVLEQDAAECQRFLKIFLLGSYERMREQAAGGVQPNLNLQIVKAIAVPLPPAKEQEAIAERLGELLSGVTEQVTAVQIGIKQSTAQRQNILRAAFAGTLVPQDPNDEPASVLLARIRAGCAGSSPQAGKRGRKAGVSA